MLHITKCNSNTYFRPGRNACLMRLVPDTTASYKLWKNLRQILLLTQLTRNLGFKVWTEKLAGHCAAEKGEWIWKWGRLIGFGSWRESILGRGAAFEKQCFFRWITDEKKRKESWRSELRGIGYWTSEQFLCVYEINMQFNIEIKWNRIAP